MNKAEAKKLVYQALAVYLNTISNNSAEPAKELLPDAELSEADVKRINNAAFRVEQECWNKSENAPDLWGSDE
jgi:hypothetical protein